MEQCVRSMRATAGPLLRVTHLGLSRLFGGCPPPGMAADMVMACLEGRQRTVAELLRAGATIPP